MADGVGLTGQAQRDRNIDDEALVALLEQVLEELQLTNLYLAEMSGERFTKRDVA